VDRVSKRDFPPAVRFALLERAVEGFHYLYDNQRDKIANSLTEAIEVDGLAAAALTLAGYLAWPELAHPVWQAWNSRSDEERIATLLPLVWALSRCGDESVQSNLEQALIMVRQLSDEERVKGNVHHASDRYWQFMEPLWQSCRWPMPLNSVETWARVAVEHPDLSSALCYVLRGIDQPIAMETYIRWSAERGGTLWDDAGEPVNPLASRVFAPSIPINTVTRDHLWSMVKDEPDHATRRIAFVFWKRSADSADLEKLRSVSPDDQLFDSVLKLRLKLRDTMAAPLLIDRMRSDPIWCGYVPLMYDEPGIAEVFLDRYEDALQAYSWRSAVPEHLPPHGVTRLIAEKQNLLLRSPQTWLSLWRTNTPVALDLVQTAVKQAKPEDLEYFFSRGEFPFFVSHRMLDSLVPVLDRFRAEEKEHLAKLAARNGLSDWIQDHPMNTDIESRY